jgi:hypothetical protein
MSHVISVSRPSAPFLFAAAYFTISMGFTIYRATLPGFALEAFDIEASQVGELLSVASIPGVFAFALGYIARGVRIILLFGAATFLMGAGLVWNGVSQTWELIWLGVFAINLGFMSFYPLINDLCIQENTAKTVAISIGRLKSFGALAIVATTLLLYVVEEWNTRALLISTGLFILAVSVMAVYFLKFKAYARSQGNLRFRRYLWPFYLLNLLAGLRSAFFKTTVIVLLADLYSISNDKLAYIILAGSISSLIGYHLIGYLATKHRPENVLSFIYGVVTLVFVGFYIVCSNSVGLYGFFLGYFMFILLYLIDSIFVGAAIITDSYLKSASASTDVIGDLSTGVSLFHLPGVIVPLYAGHILEHMGYSALFIVSFIAIVGIILSRQLKFNFAGSRVVVT